MLKWLLTLILAVFLLGLLSPLLQRWWGKRRLPGDFSVRWRGQPYTFPLASTLLLSLLVLALGRLL